MTPFLPVIQRILFRAGFSKSLEDAASEKVVLAPGQAGRRRAAISLPAQIDRVRAVQSETTQAFEYERITGGEIQHAPTQAFLLRDIWYLNGTIYAGSLRIPQVPGRESLLALGKTRQIAQAALPSTWVGGQYFGHHIVDDSATSLMAAEFGPVFRAPAPEVEKWPHAAAYRARLGVDAPVLHNARIAEAWVFEDWGMTTHRRTRLARLRNQLRNFPGARSGHGVFLRRRGAGAARTLSNEEEIERMLASQGFEIIDPANDPADEIITRCRDAGVIVGVEGSGLAHGLLGCAEGAAIVTLQHPYRFNNVWKDFTDALEMRYAFLVGEGTRDAFRIDPEELFATLDLL